VPTADNQRIRELVEAIDAVDKGQALVRGRINFTREMDTAVRDFQGHASTFRQIGESGTLPTAIEMNLLRYSVAALQHGLQLMSAKVSDEGLRSLRNDTERLRNLSADAPIRSIVPRMRRTRTSNPEGSVTAECPGCGKLVVARMEAGRIVIEFEDKDAE
jgi:hypothetical protein